MAIPKFLTIKEETTLSEIMTNPHVWGFILICIASAIAIAMCKKIGQKTFVAQDLIFVAIVLIFGWMGISMMFDLNWLP